MVQPENSTNFQAGEEAPGGESTTSAAGKRLSKPDLIKKMQGLLKKYEGNRKYLALIRDELNKEGILSPHGRVWQTHTVSDFLKKNVKGVKPSSEEKPASEKAPKGSKTRTEKVVEPPPSGEPQKTLFLDDHYPDFREDLTRDQKSIRLSKELLKRAEEKRKRDRPRSGKGMAQLLEMLLWHYLNRPEEFLWTHEGEKW